jgi:hypothetical protein
MDIHENSTRAGRSIENLDDRKNAVATDPGHGSRHGRRTPRYKDEAMIAAEKAARDRMQADSKR